MEKHSLQSVQSSTLPPAQPTYVLRGHSAQIHAVHFLRRNLRLLTGDAEGWVVLWSIPIKRPVVVWKAHNGPILGLGSWGEEKVITHGRDNKLFVWQMRQDEEPTFSTTLPIEDAVAERKQPWLLHSLAVNALNFCSFAMCQDSTSSIETAIASNADGILVATPGVQDGYINVTSLPNETRIATIPAPKDTKTGMIMAIGMCHQNNQLIVLGGYESGHAALWQQDYISKNWQVKYMNKSHTQPILSLDIATDRKHFFTSSADAVIARHPLLDNSSAETKIVQTKHAGQQSLTVRSDGKIFATAGWDGRLRVYSGKSMKELAVLKWHKEGCYALTFAIVGDTTTNPYDSVKGNDSVIKPEPTVSEQRVMKATSTHWLAAGSKDGKVSLWDIY